MICAKLHCTLSAVKHLLKRHHSKVLHAECSADLQVASQFLLEGWPACHDLLLGRYQMPCAHNSPSICPGQEALRQDETSVEPCCIADICLSSVRHAGHTRHDLHRNQRGVPDVHRLRPGFIKTRLVTGSTMNRLECFTNSILTHSPRV